jgi:hypothetical protein
MANELKNNAGNTSLTGNTGKPATPEIEWCGGKNRWIGNPQDFQTDLTGFFIRMNESLSDSQVIALLQSKQIVSWAKTAKQTGSALAITSASKPMSVGMPTNQLNISSSGNGVVSNQSFSLNALVDQVREMLERAVSLEARKKPLFAALVGKWTSPVIAGKDASFTVVLKNGKSYKVTVTEM